MASFATQAIGRRAVSLLHRQCTQTSFSRTATCFNFARAPMINPTVGFALQTRLLEGVRVLDLGRALARLHCRDERLAIGVALGKTSA
jgi:hypothetical protein